MYVSKLPPSNDEGLLDTWQVLANENLWQMLKNRRSFVHREILANEQL
jgi:hypothetical protein